MRSTRLCAGIIHKKQRSILRSLVPFTIWGQGNMGAYARAGFLQRPPLIEEALTTLEEMEEVPSAARISLASAFHSLLDGDSQRHVRDMFEMAENVSRMLLVGANPSGGNPNNDSQRALVDPLTCILLFEVKMAAGYYRQLLTPSSFAKASVRGMGQASLYLRQVLELDISRHELLDTEVLLTTEERESLPQEKWDSIAEMLRLERDLYGEYRFDFRNGAKHYIFHQRTEEQLAANLDAYAMFKHPVIEKFGNFVVEEERKFDERWVIVNLSCGVEDHKLPIYVPDDCSVSSSAAGEQQDAASSLSSSAVPVIDASDSEIGVVTSGRKKLALPNVDEVVVEEPDLRETARVIFNKPLLPRDTQNASKAHRQGKKYAEQHPLKLELVAEREKGFEESLGFMDRYFRTRPNAGLW